MVFVHIFSVLKLRGLRALVPGVRCVAGRGERCSLASLPNHWEAEPSPGFSLHLFQVSVQLVNDSASSEDPHQPGDGSQARESFQRSLSSHTVPVASHSHKRCAVKFFFQYRNFKTSKYKPIQREKNRIVPFVTWL